MAGHESMRLVLKEALDLVEATSRFPDNTVGSFGSRWETIIEDLRAVYLDLQDMRDM
jgi:hypothetical protein